MNNIPTLDLINGSAQPLGVATSEAYGTFSDVPLPQALPPASTSHFRRVFQTSDQMKEEFVKFLKTIFFQLDETKVMAGMEAILNDPSKTDEQVYQELLGSIESMKKKLPIFHQIKALNVLKTGMGKQAAELLKNFKGTEINSYVEIYDRRYVKTIQKTSGLALKGAVIAVCDSSTVDMGAKIQAGAIFSKFPYEQHVPLNDADCQDPLAQPEKSHKPIIQNEIPDNSVDMIACLGGLHHIPPSRVDGFAAALSRIMKPGAVILLRDHNVADEVGVSKLGKDNLFSMAAVVHSFVNAAAGVTWEIESKEIREFKSLDAWTEMMERHGFTRISSDELVLKDDPTENAMIALVKAPESLAELEKANAYRNDINRGRNATMATWIEWGNVRSSEQYAAFLQDHHAYAFDDIGHLRQHWKHFFHYIRESFRVRAENHSDLSLNEILFSDNMAMNLFILMGATVQHSTSAALNTPSRFVARCKYGKDWRNVAHLTALEKFMAQDQMDYAKFIQHTPFYFYPNAEQIRKMWSSVMHSNDSFFTKTTSLLGLTTNTFGYLFKAAVSLPVRKIFTAPGNVEPDTIKVLLHDPEGKLDSVKSAWDATKDENQANLQIKTIYETDDGYKLVSLPRYRPLTKILDLLKEEHSIEMLEIGGNRNISVDVLLEKEMQTPEIADSRLVYEQPILQDPNEQRYATYIVSVKALAAFQRAITAANQTIDYVHE